MIYFYHLFFKAITNPFMDDPNFQMFLTIQAITNLPRAYAAYLAWQWFMDDTLETRAKLKKSFLIWFIIDLVSLFNHTITNRIIFGKSFAAYKYEKRYNLPDGHSRGIAPEFRPHDIDAYMAHIKKVEKVKVAIRALVWLPLKFYFYMVATRFYN